MSKARVYWEVSCEEHGKRVDRNPVTLKSVVVPPPKPNANVKEMGCPICKAERKQEV